MTLYTLCHASFLTQVAVVFSRVRVTTSDHWERTCERYQEVSKLIYLYNFLFIKSTVSLSQEPADLTKQFPDLAEDFHIPQFFTADQFFSSVFRISSCGLQLWTHYDVGALLFLK